MPHRSRGLAPCFLMFFLLVIPSMSASQESSVTPPPQSEADRVPAPEKTDDPPAAASTGADIKSTEATTAVEVSLPTITPGEKMSFGEAIKVADERNLTLSAARVEIEKTQAQLSQTWGLILPILQGGMQYIHNDHADTVNFTESMGPLFAAMNIPPETMGDGDMVVRRQDMLVGTLQAALPLLNLQSWSNIQLAKKGTELAEISVENARQQMLFGVASAYFFSLMSQALIGLHEEQLRSSAAHLDTAKERLAAGMGVRIDVIRAETDLEQARQRLESAHKAFDNARDTLGHLTGTGGLPMPTDPPNIRVPSETDDALISKAKKQRPDLKSKEIAIDLTKQQRRASWMQFVPTLDAAWQFQYQFTDPPDLGSTDQSRWAAILTLTVPLYNHFRYGDLDHKNAVVRQAEIQAKEAKESIALEIRKAKRNYQEALSSVTIAEKQANLAHEALELVEESFAAGTGSSLEVTDARRTAASADINLATQHLKAQLSLLSLLKSIGEDALSLARN